MFEQLLNVALACTAGKPGYEYLTEFRFVDAFTCTYYEAAGALVTGMLVFGGITLAIYNTTGSVTIPVVLLLLTGGAVIPLVAGPAIGLAVVALLLTGAGVATALYYRWSR